MRPTSWMMKLLFAALTLFSFLVTAIPIGNPTTPSLTGIKYSTSVQLDWNSINSCNSATYEIQESTNGSLWSTVYTGAGNSGGGSASFTRSASKAIGGGCNVVSGGPRFISLSSRTNAVYYYKIRACELGRCGQYGSTLQLGQVTTPPPPPTPSIVIEQLSYHIYQDSSGKLYLVRPPIFVPIAGEIFIPIFLADEGNVIVMTESGGNWALSEISYDQFLATNAAKKEQAAVKYQNLERGADLDLIISLDGQFNNSFVVSDINANVHTVTEQDISAEAWRSIAYTAVDNAAGSNTAPSETIDLSASVLKGQAGVSGGQASYQIPIDLPPGRGGIQPRVALSYSSQGGNGIAGVGWSLNAGSAISRCGATYAQDGFTRAVTFNADTDRLCFNGQRLITSGSYGTSGTEYRTEMDSFVKVVQSGEINGTSTSFTVSRPDGSTATYGADANSRFAPAGLTTSLTWKVTQESWANGNNTIDYEYDTSVAGEHLLSDIYYTGGNGIKGNRNVRLIYGDRTDRKRSYQSKGYSQQTRVLERIATYQTGTNVRNYYLNYVQSDASQRSLLTSIKECATYSATSQCKPLTNFAWNQSQSDFVLDKLAYSDVFNTAQKIDTVLPKGDVNGDGVKDLPEVYINAESSVTGNHSEYYKSCNINLVMTGRHCISWDANNDGRTDSQFVVNGYLNIRLTLAGQNNFRNIATNIELNFQQTGIQQDTILNASDYNGDGFTDITIYRYDDGNPKVYLYKHTGNINSPYLDNGQVVFNLGAIPTSESDPLLKNEVSSVGDFDGNGLPDLLVSRKVIYSNTTGTINTPSSMPIGIVLSKGSGSFEYVELDFSPPLSIDNLYFFNLFIDLNSDGLVDWLGWKPEWIGGGSKPIHYRINKGGILSEYKALDDVTLPSRSYIAGFEGSSNEFSEGYSFFVPKFGSSFHVMDIDGDAIPELLVPDERLIEGCANIKVPSWSQHRMVDKAMCGDELYGEYYPSYTFDRDILVRETSLIPVERLDSSVYSYKALKLSASNIDIALLTGQFIPTSIIATSSEASVTDINGDGLNDFMFVSPDPASKFTWRKPSNHDIDGFVGDGTFVNRNYGAGTGQTSSDYAATDYLQSVTDGIGNQSQWRYRPLSTGEGSAGQTKMYHTDHDYVGDGYIHFGSSMYVVQSFEQSDGISDTNETEYAYKGAMYNLQGR
ncbi:FG-GAP-like repeat-containing protein, partial [Shewanella sp. D64]